MRVEVKDTAPPPPPPPKEVVLTLTWEEAMELKKVFGHVGGDGLLHNRLYDALGDANVQEALMTVDTAGCKDNLYFWRSK